MHGQADNRLARQSCQKQTISTKMSTLNPTCLPTSRDRYHASTEKGYIYIDRNVFKQAYVRFAARGHFLSEQNRHLCDWRQRYLSPLNSKNDSASVKLHHCHARIF